MSNCRLARLIRSVPKWVFLISIAAMIGGLYWNTYQEATQKARAVEATTEKAIALDLELQQNCKPETVSSNNCRVTQRQLYALLLEYPSKDVSRLVFAWEEWLSFQACHNDRTCIADKAWESAIGDMNFSPQYYAANPEKLRSYLASQLSNAQQEARQNR